MIRSNTSPKRSTLAVPGSSIKMLEKAKTIEVDEIFLDLEDSVALSEKTLAREKVVGVLINGGFKSKTVAVRVNEQITSIGIEDVSSIVLQAGKYLNSLIIPKVESAEQVRDLSKRLTELEKSGEEKENTTSQLTTIRKPSCRCSSASYRVSTAYRNKSPS